MEYLSSIAADNAVSAKETLSSADLLVSTLENIQKASKKLNNASVDLTAEMNIFQVY